MNAKVARVNTVMASLLANATLSGLAPIGAITGIKNTIFDIKTVVDGLPLQKYLSGIDAEITNLNNVDALDVNLAKTELDNLETKLDTILAQDIGLDAQMALLNATIANFDTAVADLRKLRGDLDGRIANGDTAVKQFKTLSAASDNILLKVSAKSATIAANGAVYLNAKNEIDAEMLRHPSTSKHIPEKTAILLALDNAYAENLTIVTNMRTEQQSIGAEIAKADLALADLKIAADLVSGDNSLNVITNLKVGIDSSYNNIIQYDKDHGDVDREITTQMQNLVALKQKIADTATDAINRDISVANELAEDELKNFNTIRKRQIEIESDDTSSSYTPLVVALIQADKHKLNVDKIKYIILHRLKYSHPYLYDKSSKIVLDASSIGSPETQAKLESQLYEFISSIKKFSGSALHQFIQLLQNTNANSSYAKLITKAEVINAEKVFANLKN